MHFSLVLSTLGRTDEVERFLTSLAAQTHRNFDLSVVDQNPDDRLVPLLERHQGSFTINHLRRPDERGLSKARNVGLQHIGEGVVTCPDDDCWYPPELLEQVSEYLEKYPDVDGVSGQTISDPLKLPPGTGQPLMKGDRIGRPFGVMKVPGMWALFLRFPAVRSVGEFDESLGVGAGTPWGAGEDTDYYLRLLKAGFSLYLDQNIVVFHPSANNEMVMNRDLARSYRYGAGATRVWRRHRLPLWFFLYQLLRSFGSAWLNLLKGRRSHARWHWGAFRGKLMGWFAR